MKSKYLVIGIVAAFVVLIGAIVLTSRPAEGQYDDFAQCLADSGAKMYGAWWCSHCSQQKTDFGASWAEFATDGGYIECSTQTRTQTQQCRDEGITGYPTWRFDDGTEAGGRVSMEFLSQKTGCPLV